MSNHKRNTDPMKQSPRCGAKTRKGQPCAAPAVRGAKRCRMHGGKGSGAPKGNTNAVTTGLHTAKMKRLRSGLHAEWLASVRMLKEIGLEPK